MRLTVAGQSLQSKMGRLLLLAFVALDVSMLLALSLGHVSLGVGVAVAMSLACQCEVVAALSLDPPLW